MKKSTYILLAFLVFVFLILRAIYVPLAHDEIATFFYYIQKLDYNPLAGANPDANNHILNSILGGISHKLFGYSAFSIRLPNLLSFIIYAFYVYKIGQFLSKKWTQFAFYISLLFAVYFVQFFALSRGYGMSMAFLFGGFYYCLTLYQVASAKHIAFGLGWMMLAVFANMSLLPLVLLMALAMKILAIKKYKEYLAVSNYAWTVPASLIFLVGIYYAVKISFKMKNEGSLYYGELDGFWTVTVKSQLLMLFENNGIVLQGMLIFLVLLVVVLFVYLFSKWKFQSIYHRSFFFFFLLVGSVIGIKLMAILLEVNYPEDRVGMYLFPLFIGCLCFGVDELDSKYSKYLLVLLLVFPFHFIVSINLHKISIWQGRQFPDRFFNEINKKSDSKNNPLVGGIEDVEFIFAEKNYRDNSSPKPNMIQLWSKSIYDSNLNLVLPNHPGKYFDYLISKPNFIQDILPLYDSVDYASLTKFRLYKRKSEPTFEKTREFISQARNESRDEFFEFYHESFDTVKQDAMKLSMNLSIQSLSHPFRARIAVEVRDKATGDKLEYQFFQLNWMYDKMIKEDVIVQSMILNNLEYYTSKGPIEVVVYLWNIDKQPYTLYESKVEEFLVFD